MRKTEIFEGHPINPQYIIPIDFNNVQELPESHTWYTSSIDDHKLLISSGKFGVPMIDMNDPNAFHLVKKACEEWGMFQIINHGIEIDLFEQLEDEMRKLFSLPIEQKQQALQSSDSVNGYGVVRISSFFKKLMWSEGFTIHGSPLEVARSLWPQECNASTTFCDIINKYEEAINGLYEKILSMMLMSLGLIDDDVKSCRPKTDSICTQHFLRLNSYPICPNASKAMGLAAHTDTSLLTLLYQSNTSGLQVFHSEAGWVTVEPIPGAVVVNVGDFLHIFSNGIFKSALHRALVNQDQQRFSAAFFFTQSTDVEISAPMKLVEPQKLPLYRTITSKEYLDLKYIYFDKALDHIRRDSI